MADFELRYGTSKRGVRPRHGKIALRIRPSLIDRQHEIALTVAIVLNRPHFGVFYSGIQSDYFFEMPRNSGVYICPAVPTACVAPNVTFPGDIDLLVVPYEGNELVLHRVLAIEVKALRASWAKQGKSPNGYGISQAEGLLHMGFPYAAVAHLITSDGSPREAWRKMEVARVVDETNRVELLDPQEVDCLPIDLLSRAYARLEALAPDSPLGLAASYIDMDIFDTNDAKAGARGSYWMPLARRARRNDRQSAALMLRIARFFEENPACFLDTPRYG